MCAECCVARDCAIDGRHTKCPQHRKQLLQKKTPTDTVAPTPARTVATATDSPVVPSSAQAAKYTSLDELLQEIHTNCTDAPNKCEPIDGYLYATWDPCSLERIQTPVIVPCGHIFDAEHLFRAAFLHRKSTKYVHAHQFECPGCRKKLGESTYQRRIFDKKGNVFYCRAFKTALDAHADARYLRYNKHSCTFERAQPDVVDIDDD
jgi:hypothetical protein